MRWNDKVVLVTGCTGSFGTAFFNWYDKNYVEDRNTNTIYDKRKLIGLSRGWIAQKELREQLGNKSYMRWFIGDVRDKERLKRAFKGVDIVIHSAAMKCIEASEYNPDEAMKTNVNGTQNVIDACIECGVKKSILISTDKAVNPINTYGTTKALAEKLWINANKYAANDNIKFSVVRYGNVIGSNGSVLPVWLKLIEKGVDKLPITDERMTRYWFPMERALELVHDSLDKMQGGEIFLPKMKSIRIVDLCHALEMPYKVVGIRQGEKLHEQIDENRNSGDNEFLTVQEIRESIKDFVEV